jgi:hypothetical protein
MDGFDTTVFSEGRPFHGAIPQEVKLWVGGGTVSDYLANPISWPICSEKFTELLQIHGRADFQVLSAPVYERRTQQPVSCYRVINIVRLIQCVDLDRSDISYMTIEGERILCVNRFVIDSKLVPDTVHVFRPVESESHIVISDEVAQDLRGKGLRGVALIRIRSV